MSELKRALEKKKEYEFMTEKNPRVEEKFPTREQEKVLLGALPLEKRVELMEDRIRDLEDLIMDLTNTAREIYKEL